MLIATNNAPADVAAPREDKPKCPYCGAEMRYYERRIKGYEYMGYYFCRKCESRAPRVNNFGIDAADMKGLAEALAAQRYQEPNMVLTLDEVAEMLDRIEPVYLEIKGVPGGVWLGNGDEIYSELRDGYHGSVKAYRKNHEWDAEYGASWRCWLRRPTDEERQNTPWEAPQC